MVFKHFHTTVTVSRSVNKHRVGHGNPLIKSSWPGLNRVSTPCKYAQNMLACYPKECCDNPLFNTTEAAINFGAPAGCTAKCGAGAMATPAAALFAVVMSICYRLM